MQSFARSLAVIYVDGGRVINVHFDENVFKVPDGVFVLVDDREIWFTDEKEIFTFL